MRRILKLFYQMDKKLYPIMLLSALVEAVEGFGVLLISSIILGQLLAGSTLPALLRTIAFLALGYGLLYCLRAVLREQREKRIEQFRLYYRRLITEQVMKTPFEQLEREDFVNVLNQIRQNSDNYNLEREFLSEFYSVMKSIFVMITAFLSFIQLFGAVRHLGDSAFLVSMLILGLFLLILVSTGYIVWRNKQNAGAMTELMEEVVKGNTATMYLDNEVIERYPLAKHIRLYGMQERIMEEERKMMNSLTEVVKHIDHLELKPAIFNDLSSAAISGLIYIIVGVIALFGGLGAGSIIWYAGVVNQFLSSIRQTISCVSNMHISSQRQQVVFELLDMPKEQDSKDAQLRLSGHHVIELEDVSFAYPGSDRIVLSHINLRLSGTERVALVGQNGCGKSTLIKLICRLYDPTEGRILLDGIDIRTIPRQEYAQILSVVFQDYQIFAATLAENIALSAQIDRPKAQGVVSRLGLRLTDLDQPLRRDLDEKGVEVSGGEGQKIAIARALYKDAPMVILDEPTAALDPISESEIYEQFNQLVDGKLALFISHRLSSCRFCDRILVLENGSIIQNGSHQQLLSEQGSLYERMWNAQKQYYVRS